MFKALFRWLRRILPVTLALAFLALALPRLVTALHAHQRIYTPEAAPARRVAIVFGAGLRRDGSPTAVLRDRVEAAAQLYFAGKAEALLMSGDNRFEDYNEPQAMGDYARSLGVPAAAIVYDFAGRRTYDTCYRAKEIFGVQEALLVTQEFHLPRALYVCAALGIDALGVSADQRVYTAASRLIWNLRELPATLTALVDVHLTRPLPVLGEPLPISFSER